MPTVTQRSSSQYSPSFSARAPFPGQTCVSPQDTLLPASPPKQTVTALQQSFDFDSFHELNAGPQPGAFHQNFGFDLPQLNGGFPLSPRMTGDAMDLEYFHGVTASPKPPSPPTTPGANAALGAPNQSWVGDVFSGPAEWHTAFEMPAFPSFGRAELFSIPQATPRSPEVQPQRLQPGAREEAAQLANEARELTQQFGAAMLEVEKARSSRRAFKGLTRAQVKETDRATAQLEAKIARAEALLAGRLEPSTPTF